jgi:serine/threonine protein phosphatase 1
MTLSQFWDQPAPASIPPGQRVYAVGDIHGQALRLDILHKRIAADAEARPVERVTIVYLGDYVDRGPSSAGVLERLRREPAVPGAEVVHLMGNHEAMMLDALRPDSTPEARYGWLQNGGVQALASYPGEPLPMADLTRWVAEPALHADPPAAFGIPAADMDFLRGLKLSWRCGGYFFAHAGVRPFVPLDEQAVQDLLWIRQPFLGFKRKLDAVVVHGHTPAKAVEVLPHRIGVDTGCCFGGPLSAVALEENTIGLLQA